MASCVQFIDANKSNQEEKSKQLKLLDYIDNAFLHFIPSTEVKDMAPIYRYAAGLTLTFLQLFLFIYFLSVGISTAQNTKFLTPNSYYDSSRCSQVLTSTTNTFYATKSGQWSTQIGVNFAEMTYRFDLNQYSASSSDLYRQLSGLRRFLSGVIDPLANNRTLGENILFWTTYRTVSPDGKISFSLSGDIKRVLNQQYHDVKIASKYGLCNISSVSDFSSTTGRFLVAFSYSEFMANDVCRAAISPSTAANMSYSSFLDDNKFIIEIDTQAIVTALNININCNTMILTTANDGSVNIPGLSIVGISPTEPVYYYVDPLYPGMEYTICAGIPNSALQPVLCGLQLGNTFAIPFLLDQGLIGTPCSCNADGNGGIDAKGFSQRFVSYYCNKFEFFVGVLMFNSMPSDSGPLLEYITSFANALDANRAAYNAAFYTSKYQDFFANATVFSYEEVFSFCESAAYGGCTIINLATYPGANPRNIVSDNYYQLFFGACNDSVSFAESALNELVFSPYGPLVESYVECIGDKETIYSNSLGIAIGNVGAYIPVICLILVAILSAYQRISGKKVLASYTKIERDTALDAFATLLLLHRDNKFVSSKDAPDQPPPSFDVISLLVDEIRKSLNHNPDLQQMGVSEAAKNLADAARNKAHQMEEAITKVKLTELNPIHRNPLSRGITNTNVDNSASKADSNIDVVRISRELMPNAKL